MLNLTGKDQAWVIDFNAQVARTTCKTFMTKSITNLAQANENSQSH